MARIANWLPSATNMTFAIAGELRIQCTHASKRAGHRRFCANTRHGRRRRTFQQITGHIRDKGIHGDPPPPTRRIDDLNIAMPAILENDEMRAAEVQNRTSLD